MFISCIILVILVLCIKTLINDKENFPCSPLDNAWFTNADTTKGAFNNALLVDSSASREQYGLPELASNASSVDYSYSDNNESDNTEGGGGNFTNRKYQDVQYLEDVMDNKCWSDICMHASSGSVAGKKCESHCSANPGDGYQRTFGDTPVIYNDDMNDVLFKQIQYKNKSIYVPWSDLYNNIVG